MNMTDELIELTYSVKQALKDHPLVKKLDEIEDKMENDVEVQHLSFVYQVAQDRFNDFLKLYATQSSEVVTAQKALYEAKKQLDEHPLVREYYAAFRPVNDLYDEIQKKIFSPFGGSKSCGGY
jgi:cell fate (sporulation/competence/biofilm development) regulator YlbF (YheA/YmcA/DUF963 family)